MKVFITTAYPYHETRNHTAKYLQESYKADPFKKHELVSSPDEADIIIFAESHPSDYYLPVLKNPIYKKFKSKCYLYHDHDKVVTLLPTISPSIKRDEYEASFTRPFSYIFQNDVNSYIDFNTHEHTKKYLFSFIGASRTNAIRKEILSLEYKDCLLLDTSDKKSWELPKDDKDAYFKFYADKCFESKFILCPAGIGPNSYRLYESLKIGIPPVIISDQWMPSEGPNWDEFSIRIKESEISKIPEILEKREAEALVMGAKARQAWIDWFAKDKQFHLLTEACVQLHDSRGKLSIFVYIKQYFRFLEPYHAKGLLRHFRRKLR